MSRTGERLGWIAVPVVLALATSGCASKKYVRNQVNTVNQRVSKVENESNEKIAYINNKEQNDISQVNERLATTNQRLTEVGNAAKQANSAASQAMQKSQANEARIGENSTAISTLASGVANAMNYQLVEKADVTFAFGQAVLTPEAKAALDQVAQKVHSLPRSVIELVGFTDSTGSKSYNLALSRRRADAVARYLVQQRVPLRSIHIIGLGAEAPPEGLTADLTEVNPNPSRAELRRLARRVKVSVYGAGDITQGAAARLQQ